MKKNLGLIGLLMLTALSLAGCGTAGLNLFNSNSSKTMEKYSVSSSKTIGKTNAKDNAIEKNGTFLNPSLPGINIQTVVLNLNTLGFESSSEFLNSFATYRYSGSTGEVDGIRAMYSCFWLSPVEVKEVVMDVNAPYGTPLSEFKALAEKDLGFLATLPYTNSKPQQAKEWVINTIKAAKQPNGYVIEHQFGGVIEPKYGGVKFYLYPYTVNPHQANLPKGMNAQLSILYSKSPSS